MTATDVDVVVIGAGFAGLRTLHTMRGLGLEVVVLDANGGIRGVWHWNRNPGTLCVVESYDYSYALSIEDLLTAHPAVAQAHVVPIPDARMGEVGVAWIILKDSASADPDELLADCTEQLARFKVPRHVLFTTAEDLPTTASGEPRKFLIAERVAPEPGVAPA